MNRYGATMKPSQNSTPTHSEVTTTAEEFTNQFMVTHQKIPRLISRCRGSGCDTPVVGFRYQSCFPPCRTRHTVRVSSRARSSLFLFLLRDLLHHPEEEIRRRLFDSEPLELGRHLPTVIGRMI